MTSKVKITEEEYNKLLQFSNEVGVYNFCNKTN